MRSLNLTFQQHFKNSSKAVFPTQTFTHQQDLIQNMKFD